MAQRGNSCLIFLNDKFLTFPLRTFFLKSAKIDQAFADDINYALGLFVTVDIVRWCVLSVGIVLFVVGIIMAIVLHSVCYSI